jgi:hypothetical protein
VKRSSSISRYTSLVRTAWQRKPSVPKPRRRRPAVPPAIRDALRERSGGLCEIGLPECCTRWAVDPHHRLASKTGGRRGRAKVAHDQLCNLVATCRQCHQEITSATEPRLSEYRDLGVILQEHEDPWDTLLSTPAMVRLHGGPVYLADSGVVVPADLSPLDAEALMDDPWIWLPNVSVTRLHAVRQGSCPECGPPACRGAVSLTTVPVAGHQPPRCRRCERITGDTDA